MKRLLCLTFTVLSMCFCSLTHAVTVEDSKGTFTLDYIPKRIVVLEFSFADALASVNVSPVGIADDKDPERVLKQVRDIIGEWQSVGTRSQPSLEVISSLKPDLIIADIGRHEGVYEDLKKIAPTLILPSRRETYEDNLKAAAVIGKVVGKDQEMQARLAKHKIIMQNYATQLPKDFNVQFVVARADNLFMHPANSYAGGVIKALGLKNPSLEKDDKQSSRQIGLEQLLAINPDYLIVGTYVSPNIIDKWEKEPLWSVLKVARNQHIFRVNGNVWSRCRGIMAAENMAKDLTRIFNQ
ncbi:Fe(3+) dicitrate ABC transporter substrate-binding protein [Marinomonas primoryensis]|uniref:Fe(3+) dicitrate ABC transporter substrate-binding protein n=1 Tax=Marinomonas primoryensis TaxID=178399 RepID=A0ABV0L4Q0_9GAMM